ncbi:MAG TPA: sigma-54-dependent Fis family transcriptional regulator, partial [Phycisphaerales bacterium]|nr:sigma-54-dependent Fis family transcriptional regulator [Phycisphaerales bacterium]
MKNDGAMTGLNVLLVDGDRVSAAQHTALLEGNGLRVTRAESLARARIILEAGRYDVAVVMAELPDGDVGQLVSPRDGGPPVVLLTERGTVRGAVEAIRRGAADYLVCPVTADELCEAVSHAVAGAAPHDAQGSGPDALDGLVGADLRMAKVFDLIDAVAAARTTVLLTGESGTGKSLVARAIHRRSPRRTGPFVEVACGAMPDTLLESELFGHVKGAFTHAVSDRPGKFAAADRGTIFLDEISTASPQLQVKLLRVLQE